jgi:glutathione peroxidase
MNVHDFTVKTIDGKPQKLDAYKGKLMLIVNVASKCGLTPHYAGLESMYRKLHGKGLEVLGFPCNQFAGQEPGSEDEIKDFCSTNYEVSFALFAKMDVNGDAADPLFKHLRAAAPGHFSADTPGAERLFKAVSTRYPDWIGTDAVKWNFTKFLVGKDGRAIKRYAPTDTPASLKPDIEAALAA